MVFFNSRNGREHSPDAPKVILGSDSFVETVRKLTTEYNLSVDEDERRVTLTLGDRSLRDALDTFQLASFTHHERFAIRPSTLRGWEGDPRFEGVPVPNGRVSIEIVPESAHLPVNRQDQLGLNTPAIGELALAGAAFFLITGKHLFDDGPCRGADGILVVSRGGIEEARSTSTLEEGRIAASRRVPCL